MRKYFFHIKLSLVLLVPVCIALVTIAGCDKGLQSAINGTPEILAYKTTISPHWFSDNRKFWYQNDLPGGKREFMLVDVSRGVKEPFFDHKLMTAALSNAGIKNRAAENLQIDNLYYDQDKNTLAFREGGTYWKCDLKNYNLTRLAGEEEEAERSRWEPPVTNIPRRSTRTGPATTVTFINRTSGVIKIFWADTRGNLKPYGQLEPGRERLYQTYDGHVWHVFDNKDTLLTGFESQENPIIAEITGKNAAKLEPDKSAVLPLTTSPDGKWTVSIVGNNVYIRPKHGGKLIKVSDDGSYDSTYILPQWTRDSKTIVAWRMNRVKRKEVHLLESAPDGGKTVNLSLGNYPLPLPGDELSSFELNLFNVETGKQIKPVVDKIDLGYPNIRWNSDGRRFTYEKVDRGHQRFRVIEVDSQTGKSRTIIDEKSKTFIWTINQDLKRVNWVGETSQIIYASERDGWQHLYLVDAETGEFKNQITRGNYVVREIDKIDKEKRQIWFKASGMNAGQDPYLIHYYRINFDGTGLVALTDGNGNHSVQFSPDRKYIIDTYSRVDMPPVHELRRTSDGRKICALEQADISPLKESGFKTPEVFTAKGRDGKTDIWGIICRPADFDPDKKYPVIEDIYAGPQDSYVPKSFIPFNVYRALTDLGFIVVKMDGMGTANRSKAFHDVCWKDIKDAGFPDRIKWIKTAAEKYPYMDISRVGIYGVSAGGQNAAAAVLFHPEFYKVAVASCGCHDNRLDKAAWNEQWMGYPVAPHYAESSNIENAYRLKGKLLLIVGDKDDNVPPVSTTLFAEVLKEENKDFELMVAKGEGHGIGGTEGINRMKNFFIKHLKN